MDITKSTMIVCLHCNQRPAYLLTTSRHITNGVSSTNKITVTLTGNTNTEAH